MKVTATLATILSRALVWLLLLFIAAECSAQYGGVILKDGRLISIHGRAEVKDDLVVFTYKNGTLMRLPLQRVDLDATRAYEKRWAHLIDNETNGEPEEVIPPKEGQQEVTEEALATLVERYNTEQQAAHSDDSPRRTLVYTGSNKPTTDPAKTDTFNADDTEHTDFNGSITDPAALQEFSEGIFKNLEQRMQFQLDMAA